LVADVLALVAELLAFVALVEALETNETEFHKILFEDGNVMILNNEKTKTSDEKILQRYMIRSDRSDDI